MLRLPEQIRNDILVHAREGNPLEVCGILGGSGGEVVALFRMTNPDASPEHFTMDPREQFGVMEELRSRGLEMTAFYHSHPKGPPYPSAEDIRLAFYPDVHTVIVSLADPAAPSINGFQIRDGVVKPVRLEIIRP